MNITRALPQFERETVLVIACGEQDATFFAASNGMITKTHAFRLPKPRYSDTEKFFALKSKGKVRGVGGDKGPSKLERHQLFSKLFRASLKVAIGERDIDGLYLFAPAYVFPVIDATLTKALAAKVRKRIKGNYANEHPFILLSMLEGNAARKRLGKRR